jgi:uncharacterized MAPEG superfamily protein
MTPELTALAALVGFQMVFGLSVSAIVSTRTGAAYILGSREGDADLQSGFVGRMHRARSNTFEALIYFTATVVVVVLGEASDDTTAAAAWTFFGARLLFVVCYALNLNPWRSTVWMVGWLALAVMLWQAFST